MFSYPSEVTCPFLFQCPLSAWNMRRTTIGPPPATADDSEATCIHFPACLWHILCSCLQATSERCPLPGLHLNTEAFFRDSSLSETDYIKRSCFQDRARTHQWNLEQSSEKPVPSRRENSSTLAESSLEGSPEPVGTLG